MQLDAAAQRGKLPASAISPYIVCVRPRLRACERLAGGGGQRRGGGRRAVAYLEVADEGLELRRHRSQLPQQPLVRPRRGSGGVEGGGGQPGGEELVQLPGAEDAGRLRMPV